MSRRSLAMVASLAAAIAFPARAGVVAQDATARSETVPAAIRTRCLTCHGVDLIEQQRLSRTGWERELDKMIRWGAVVPDSERGPVLDTLQQWSDRRPAADAARDQDLAKGRDLFEQRCLRCHRADIVEQQRLTAAGWRRELDKMIGWGARVDEADRDVLLAYLAARFGPR